MINEDNKEVPGTEGNPPATDGNPPAEGAKTDDKPKDDARIPKERFDEVNEARKSAEARAEKMAEQVGSLTQNVSELTQQIAKLTETKGRPSEIEEYLNDPNIDGSAKKVVGALVNKLNQAADKIGNLEKTIENDRRVQEKIPKMEKELNSLSGQYPDMDEDWVLTQFASRTESGQKVTLAELAKESHDRINAKVEARIKAKQKEQDDYLNGKKTKAPIPPKGQPPAAGSDELAPEKMAKRSAKENLDLIHKRNEALASQANQ